MVSALFYSQNLCQSVFMSVRQNTWHKQFNDGRNYFGSQFQRYQFMVTCLCPSAPLVRQYIMVVGACGIGSSWEAERNCKGHTPVTYFLQVGHTHHPKILAPPKTVPQLKTKLSTKPVGNVSYSNHNGIQWCRPTLCHNWLGNLICIKMWLIVIMPASYSWHRA
jgi:hypothetical protein